MIRRPPRSTRPDTLFPYTTLFRSDQKTHRVRGPMLLEQALEAGGVDLVGMTLHPHAPLGQFVEARTVGREIADQRKRLDGQPRRNDDQTVAIAHPGFGLSAVIAAAYRSEELQVGEECVKTCRALW